MNINDFFITLRRAMPSTDELASSGLTPGEIKNIHGTFSHFPRARQDTKSGSELVRMIQDNDCSNIEVGLIRFLEEPRVHRHGTQIALCEADPIVVAHDGKVMMHDHANPDHAILCATGSEEFLEALAAFLAFRREKSKWKGRAQLAAEACATKAGGPGCGDFFRLLCGYLN